MNVSGAARGLAFAAKAHIDAAFREAGRRMNLGEEAALRVRIQDAIQAGMRDPRDIAMQALAREGHTPRRLQHGAVTLITIRGPA
ncbi:hypothetical protein OPKNFCMD_3027 [Methylobacterium crusticola]|uniref:Uncharacterized protein n=1 Tax=Methylobacterium crusticola TaxID=1697972 RepID=A0ABQ4QY24_9HYPH|nr:hypothetical protein [Methylobacterium crusticola]GJD50288.1 hypothetical protein OPKNFCMD_3027 [Methylobacterium crusticola]